MFPAFAEGVPSAFTLTSAATSSATVPLRLLPVVERADAPGPASIEPVSAFLQVAPKAGAVPSRRTELRLWQDGKSLHIEVRAFDPQPAGIVARQMRRDVEGMMSEDHVTLVFDPDGEGRNGFLFAVNPHGAQFDALVFDGGQMRFDWDAIWHSEARIDNDGWRADIVIPLAVFGSRLASGTDMAARTWRFNAERWMPAGSERVRLAGAQPDKEVFSLGDALPMPAIHADRQGWGLRIKPSLRATSESSAASGTGESRQRLAPGLELFHQSDSGLRTTAAFNIDFGEADADERSVNLTRFELFRPEKREFFLHDAGRFTFGGLSSSGVIPYYSRRVGLDQTGHARSLDAGIKFSGQLAGFDFGVFGARVAGGPTEPGSPDQPSSDVAVMRVARPMGAHSRVGMIATHGNPEGTSGSSLWGLDYQYRATDLSVFGQRGKTLEAHGWVQESTNAGQGTGQAWGASVLYPNVGLTGYAEVQQVGEKFDPALGYSAEAGATRGLGDIGWWHRTATGDNVTGGIDWSFRRRLDRSERSVMLNPEVGFTNAAGDTAMAEVFVETDRVANGYSPVPGAWISPGSYRWDYLFAYAETSPSRVVSAVASLRSGGYYDGHRHDQMLNLAWKPGTQWGWRLGAQRNAVVLPSGSFNVHTATLRLDHTPTTRYAQSLLLQWDNISHQLGFSARARWAWARGYELIFAVDRLGYTGELRQVEPVQTKAMLKSVWNFER